MTARKVPPPELVERVIACAREPWRAIFELCGATGARINEIVNLSWSCVPEPGRVRIEEHEILGKAWRPKRPASVRELMVHPELLPVRPEDAGPADSIWGFSKPQHASAYRYYLCEACEAAGLDSCTVRSHDFRRLFVTKGLLAGAPPLLVSRAAGHASLKSTLRYIVNLPVPLDVRKIVSYTSCTGANGASELQPLVTPKNWRNDS